MKAVSGALSVSPRIAPGDVPASAAARRQAPAVAQDRLKARMLPPIDWNAMLRGREWMARPQMAG